MTEMPAAVALLGLPLTGKSTFLGAIWQLAQDTDEASVEEIDFTGDRSYLQALGEAVARAEEVPRTEVDSEEGMRLSLGFAELGSVALDIPDLSGETLRRLVEDRVVHDLLRQALESAGALILFIHPGQLGLPLSIAMAQEIFRESIRGGESVEDEPTNEPREVVVTPFELKAACTSAKYVDALENVLEILRDRWPVRLAVVISAWDEVDQSALVTPEQWLRQNVPALWGFVTSNPEMLTAQVFGVSALGGRLPGDRESLLARGSVRNRAYARGATGTTLPMTAPLTWALWG